jgi:hypothetical protein
MHTLCLSGREVFFELFFAGDPEGGASLWAGRGPVLHGAGVSGRAVAVLLPGLRGRHLLREHASGQRPHRGVHPHHVGGRRHLPAREVQQREGHGAGALALGPRVILLRRVERRQGQEEGSRGPSSLVIFNTSLSIDSTLCTVVRLLVL